MPELPEVETICRQLSQKLVGRRIERVQVFDNKLPNLSKIVGSSITSVRRIGKQIAIELRSNGSKRLMVVHLRMSGSLTLDGCSPKVHTIVRRSSAFGSTESSSHVRAGFQLDEGSLLFADPRRFGTIKLVRDPEQLTGIGVDPVGAEFTVAVLTELVSKTAQSLKQFLLRQDLVVGVGNIYAAEILYRARLSPFRPTNSLTAAEVKRLHRETVKVLNLAIDANGTTFSDYQDARGEAGSFQKFLKVYEREGEKCPRCKALIRRAVQNGRSTYYCANCQR